MMVNCAVLFWKIQYEVWLKYWGFKINFKQNYADKKVGSQLHLDKPYCMSVS